MTITEPIETGQRDWQRIRGALARRLFLDRHAEFWLREVNPAWSLGAVRARVMDVVEETTDVKTFVLRPNARWRGHRAGQYTVVEVEIDGVRVRRCYSISSAPADPFLSITVKRLPGGRVSGWLHDHVRRGDVLRLQPAAGEFVLPEPPSAALLMLSGGSGITPVMSMVRDLASRGAVRDVVFVHCARSRTDVIFRGALDELCARHPGLRLALCLDDDPARPGRFGEAELRRLVPDFAERETFLCGPAGLMERVERLWESVGAAGRLRRERFVSAAVPSESAGEALEAHVRLTRSGRSLTATGSSPLLEQLERAGERPAYGCRMGICQTCKCRKKSGVVRNIVTGAVSSEPDEDIQLCISVARSDLELVL
jgi:ferredoxin-NADP reductase